MLDIYREDLQVPVNYLADEPTSARTILKDTWKDNAAFNLMKDVYFLGMVDDAAFVGNKSMDTSKIQSDYDGVLIFGVILSERENNRLPTRSQLAEVARAFNREYFYTPVIVVYKYGTYLAFANTERLKYKQEWREGEKAGKVSLLRDIDIKKPHAGHLRILNDLIIPETGKNKVDSFAKLYAYWQDVFSVNILNKKFYHELSNWYFWAVKEVTFPSEPTAIDEHLKKIELATLRQEHNAKNVIRLLTRFLFVWFIKEKKLIPEELFNIGYLKDELLKDLSPVRDEGLFKEANIKSLYYKAILQNLFFASLNCPIEPSENGDNRKRGFRLRDNYGQHRDANYLMRYKNQFKNPEKFLELINDIVPFLNGGLFECLDNKIDKIYIDGFSDNLVKPHQLVVPDYLFFGFDHEVDLSEVVGINTRAFKNARVKGLISILESYKFTIAENTPIEEDVALDPELLGKVFENLLASYNPETKTNARKQTGSFYTPREIVNYMVDESLIAYLKNRLKDENIEAEKLDKQLHELLSYDDINPFAQNDDLQKQIILALDNCKILDPACGSGAFPMGILQKMVHVLQKVDPENRYWQELQLNKAVKETEGAFALTGKKEREHKLIEINEAFDEQINDPDYARKLFLVEDCIYGVDIQPIATQISKLRFFISLVVDQKVDKDRPNFGIRALPNLETKFVAANTLIGIEKPKDQMNLFDNQEIKELELELKNVRHRLFSAKSPATKRKLRDKDKEIRGRIGELLLEHGWTNKTARQLAEWDPYDQNTFSPFFDSEWMFGIRNGFDVVIGNPPYIGEKGNKHLFDKIRETSLGRRFYHRKVDMFYFFIHQGIDLLSNECILLYITTNYFMTATGAVNLRRDLKERANIRKLINFNELKIFQSAAGQHNMILLLKKSNQSDNVESLITSRKGVASENILNSVLKGNDSKTDYFNMLGSDLFFGADNYIKSGISQIDKTLNALLKDCVELGRACNVTVGLYTGADKFTENYRKKYGLDYQKNSGIFIITKNEKKNLKLNKFEDKLLRPFYKNSDISKYWSKTSKDKYLINVSFPENKDLDFKKAPTIFAHLKKYEEVLRGRKSNDNGLRAVIKAGYWWSFTIRQLDFNQPKIVVPQRAKTNVFGYNEIPWYASADVYFITSKEKSNYDLKFILGLLNSTLYFKWLYYRGKRKGEMLELYQKPLSEIPIPKATTEQQQPFIKIVNQILAITKDDEYFQDHLKQKEVKEYQKKIDRLVYRLYNLTQEEIAIVEGRK